MSMLDCNTPQGQIYIGAQMAVLPRLEKAWDCQIATTPADSAADIDAIFIKKGVVAAVAEIKSREMSLKDLERFGSYLITLEKLVKLQTVSLSLAVPGLLIVSLLKDRRIVYWKICDPRCGPNFSVEMSAAVTETRATCNGGKVYRENAYISLEKMIMIE